VKTFFNMLGPMVNPAFPPRQLVGVFSLELARKFGYLYQQSGKAFVVLHSLDGYDEISLTGPYKYFFNGGEQIAGPGDMGLPQRKPEELYGGGSIEDSAKIFLNVLEGKGTEAQKDAVVANAAMAVYCADQAAGLENAIHRADEAITSGKALEKFRLLLEDSK